MVKDFKQTESYWDLGPLGSCQLWQYQWALPKRWQVPVWSSVNSTGTEWEPQEKAEAVKWTKALPQLGGCKAGGGQRLVAILLKLGNCVGRKGVKGQIRLPQSREQLLKTRKKMAWRVRVLLVKSCKCAEALNKLLRLKNENPQISSVCC